jgi:large subunit ribosomal protein L10
MAHVSSFKKQEVGLVDVEGIRARQLQMIRQDLRKKVLIRGSKNTLLAIALKNAEKKLDILESCLRGGASLICTGMDPFQLNMLLERSRTPAPAKPGDAAPNDIVIAAGDTGFPPGPLVGELQRAGVPARIERGSIIVQKDHVFVRAGEVISEQKAVILAKLGMEPMTAGLELLGVCEEGTLFEPSVLHVDIEGVISRIGLAHQNALNVSIEAGIITQDTITLLIQKAVRYSTSLALEACIITPDTISDLLAKACHTARVINSLITGEPAHEPEPHEESKESTEEKEEAEEEALDGLGALFG